MDVKVGSFLCLSEDRQLMAKKHPQGWEPPLLGMLPPSTRVSRITSLISEMGEIGVKKQFQALCFALYYLVFSLPP